MNIVCEKCLQVLKESLDGKCKFSFARIDGNGPLNPDFTCYQMVEQVLTGTFYCDK